MDPPQAAAGEQLAQAAMTGVGAVVVHRRHHRRTDAQLAAEPFERLHIAGGDRHRLLDQHVQAGAHRLLGGGTMLQVRTGHDHRIGRLGSDALA